MTGQHLAAVIPPSIVIETERLLLRAYRDEDLAEMVALAGNWEVARWLTTLPHPYDDGHGRDWIAHVRREHATGRPRTFAIARKSTDRLIGGGGLDGSRGVSTDEPALGYWLGQPYWGNGFGREAAATIIDYGFRTLGLETIRAYTDPANIASQKVLQACGLRRVADINLVTPMRLGARHVPLFRISRQDYLAL